MRNDLIIQRCGPSFFLQIPHNKVFKFLEEYANTFIWMKEIDEAQRIASVESYGGFVNGLIDVKLTIFEEDHGRFLNFLAEFAKKHELKFENPKKTITVLHLT